MVGIGTLLLWGILGWLVGILIYFTGGFVVAMFPRTRDFVNSMASHYDKTAMHLLGRAVVVERGTKFDIYRTTHDGEKNADQFTMDGETAHVTNETGLLSTLHKKPFGLLPDPQENVACYVSPELAEFGEIETRRKEMGELTDGNGEYQETVELPKSRPLGQLRNYARRMIPGNRNVYDLEETVDLYKQSQRLFGESKTTQLMILIVAFGAAMLVTWLILTQAGGTIPGGPGGGGPVVPPIGG